MFKIKTLNAIAPIGLSRLPREHYDISTDCATPDALLVRSQDMHTMPIPSSVEVVGRAGAGVNNIPVSVLTERGIPVLNTPGANANAVKELVIAGMLLACRNICPAWQFLQQMPENAATFEQQIEQQKKQFVGIELPNRTLGVIGLGSIGVKVANSALALGMKVIGYDPTITVQRAWELSSQVQQTHRLEDLLTQADFISIHVPLNQETRGMLNLTRLQAIKVGAVLLNFARESIIPEEALLEILKQNKLRAYVTDFPTIALKNHPKVIALPHLGASTAEAEENCAMMIADQVRAYLEDGTIKNSVNFPDVEFPRGSYYRLSIANLNIPNMVAQFSTCLAEAHLNIMDLINKSRGEIAYTLIDLDALPTKETQQVIAKIQGVVKVRNLGIRVK